MKCTTLDLATFFVFNTYPFKHKVNYRSDIRFTVLIWFCRWYMPKIVSIEEILTKNCRKNQRSYLFSTDFFNLRILDPIVQAEYRSVIGLTRTVTIQKWMCVWWSRHHAELENYSLNKCVHIFSYLLPIYILWIWMWILWLVQFCRVLPTSSNITTPLWKHLNWTHVEFQIWPGHIGRYIRFLTRSSF